MAENPVAAAIEASIEDLLKRIPNAPKEIRPALKAQLKNQECDLAHVKKFVR